MDITIDAIRQHDRSYILRLNEYELQFIEKAVLILNKKRESSRASYSKRYGSQSTRVNTPNVNILRSDMEANSVAPVVTLTRPISLNILPPMPTVSS